MITLLNLFQFKTKPNLNSKGIEGREHKNMNEANEYLRCAAPPQMYRVSRELTNQLPINKLRVRIKIITLKYLIK